MTANQGGAPWTVDLTKVGGSSFSLGQQLAPASLPVVLTAAQISTLTPLSTVAATQSGTWNIATITALTGITNPLPAGTNVIGHVITDTGSTTAVTGTVTTSGTVTANAGTNLNTSLLALESGGNLATLAGAVSSSIFQDNIKQVNGATVNVGTGAASTGTIRVAVASDSSLILAAGSASIGILGANSGVDIGDVTINNGTGAAAVNIQDGGNTITVDGTIAFSNSSIAVTQSTSPWIVAGGGTAGTAASGVVTVQGIASMTPVQVSQATGTNLHVVVDSGAVTVTNATAANLKVAATLDAETTKVIGVTRTADGAGNLLTSNSTTYTAKFGLDNNLLGTLGTAFSTAGKVDVKVASGDIASGAVASGAIASGAVASGAFASGSVSDGAIVTLGAKTDAKSTATDGTSITIMQVLKEISAMVQAPASTPVTNAGTFAVQAAGDVAHDSVDAGNPVKIGGYASTAIPTAVSAAADRVNAFFDLNGRLAVHQPFSTTRMSTNTTTTIKSGAGFLHTITFNNPDVMTTANETITLYDNTAGSGTILALVNIDDGQGTVGAFTLHYDIVFGTGLTAVTTGSGTAIDMTFAYR